MNRSVTCYGTQSMTRCSATFKTIQTGLCSGKEKCQFTTEPLFGRSLLCCLGSTGPNFSVSFKLHLICKSSKSFIEMVFFKENYKLVLIDVKEIKVVIYFYFS